jgi:hypothetical protein
MLLKTTSRNMEVLRSLPGDADRAARTSSQQDTDGPIKFGRMIEAPESESVNRRQMFKRLYPTRSPGPARGHAARTESESRAEISSSSNSITKSFKWMNFLFGGVSFCDFEMD